MTTMETEQATPQEELTIEVGEWKMDPSLKQRWVTALRSGKYKQGTKEFRNARGEYCVLGVLCEVAGEPLFTEPYLNNYTFVESVTNYVDPQVFWEKNDNGWTFEELADYIEANF